jgi:hypothetical protein
MTVFYSFVGALAAIAIVGAAILKISAMISEDDECQMRRD